MIRREITSPDGKKLWLLISQVDHARVSGALTSIWREHYTSDVIHGIAHHDDGWGAWEAEPKLNPEIGAPFSFLEMPIPAALVIWDHSIAAAGNYGPLAAYIVAGHFYNLLSGSENAKDPLADAWLTAKRKLRTAWLDEWVRANPSHSLEYAKQAQHMLLVADLFSLWLCCDCPTGADRETTLGKSAMKLQTDLLFNQFQFSASDFAAMQSADGRRLKALSWTVRVHPYPFNAVPLELAAPAVAVPAVRYETWEELRSASWPIDLHWQIMRRGPGSESEN